MLDTIQHWMHSYRALGWPIALGVGVTVMLLSTVVGLLAVLGLPADYFVRGKAPPGFWQSHVVLRWVFFLGKNLFGAIAFLAGLVMSLPLIPGPGVVLMLVGLAAMDFPGKRALERRLLAEPHLLASVNRLRARFGRPPIQAVGKTRPGL